MESYIIGTRLSKEMNRNLLPRHTRSGRPLQNVAPFQVMREDDADVNDYIAPPPVLGDDVVEVSDQQNDSVIDLTEAGNDVEMVGTPRSQGIRSMAPFRLGVMRETCLFLFPQGSPKLGGFRDMITIKIKHLE